MTITTRIRSRTLAGSAVAGIDVVGVTKAVPHWLISCSNKLLRRGDVALGPQHGFSACAVELLLIDQRGSIHRPMPMVARRQASGLGRLPSPVRTSLSN